MILSLYRNISAYRAIIVICLIAISIPLSFWRYNTLETGVGPSPTNSRIGVCDGSCVLDTDRLTRNLKQEAAKYFQQKQDTLACQYLRWAALGDITGAETTDKTLDDYRSQAEDTTDAEAKIDYENRCTNMQCPCISFVVVVQLIDQNVPNADYINGMSRSILQGAYLQQKKWNKSSNGPKMYLFIANVSPDVPGDQEQEPTQQDVADQILRIQQTDLDHIIVGVVGLPFGTNTLTNKLNDAHIPMVSIAPLKSLDSKPYLFSVTPSLNDEINEVVNFCCRRQNIQYYYDGHDYYSRMFTALFKASPSLPPSLNPSPYEDIASLANQVATSDSNLIIFIGPAEDTTNFLIQLRTAEKANNSKSHTVLTGDDFYQWVYKYFTPDQRTAFDNVRFVAFAYPDSSQLPNDPHILDDFNNTFDPGGKRSGNIYTYRRASSDAILAYDALSLFANAQNNTTCTTSCDASAWGDTLQRYIRSKSFKGVSGQISFTSGASVPDSKFLFFLVIQDQKNGNPQDFSGRY
jgi:hypothetical protein